MLGAVYGATPFTAAREQDQGVVLLKTDTASEIERQALGTLKPMGGYTLALAYDNASQRAHTAAELCSHQL